jgi:quaternary ammonium compound-resistance protein SugE
MPWVWLVLAGVCEVVWAVGLKVYGFRLSLGSAVTVVMMLLSFYLLSLAMRHIPLGTAYGVWTGIGAVGAAAYGIARLGEPRDLPRLLCIGLIVAGIVGLKLLSPKAG